MKEYHIDSFSSSLGKYNIEHQWDVWHGAKNFAKKLNQVIVLGFYVIEILLNPLKYC